MKSKNTSYNKLVDYLTKKRIKDNDKKITHISIGDYNKGYLMGSFSIDDNDLITFYNYYNKALTEGYNLHMLESPKEQGPIIIDIDFKYELFKNSEARIYTDYDINNIVKHYTESINKYIILNDEEGENCMAYILEKDKPKFIDEIDDKYEYKDGLHIIFPNLCVSTNTQLIIRLDTIEKMKENNELKHLGLSNDIEDVFDINVIGRNCWLLYGSTKKDEENNKYKLTKILNNDLNDSDIKEDIYELTSLLSIRKFNKDKLSKFKNNYNEDEIKKEYDRKLNLKSNNGISKNFRITYNDIDMCRKLIKLLNIYRSDNYKEWLEVGFCLKNIDDNLLIDWIDFSKQSKKFKNGECEKLWKSFKKSGLSMGSLHMWAKNDNPDRYSDIIMSQYDGLITKSLDATHYKVALVFYKMYQSNFICESIKHKEIYEFKCHRWIRNDSSHCIVKKLNEDFYSLYDKYTKIIYNKMSSLNENEFEQKNEKKNLENKYKAAQNVCKNIHNANYKDKLLSELHKLYYDEYFFNNLDSNKNLICFNNGVYDLDKMELRNGRPEDCISLSTNINYIVYDSNNPNIIKLEKFFEEIQPNLETRRFLYIILASCLDGNQRNQIFPILTGNGANGKGRLAKLVEDALGDYASTIDVSFLTQKRTSPGNANPQLAKTKGRRIIILQEPDNCDKLNTGLMKSITGGDKLEARKLYGDPFIIDPQFKTFLVCNNLPKIETIDGGTWRRVRAIPFKCTFKDNPDINDPYQKKANPDLDDDLKLMKEALLSKLIEIYKETKGKITFIPDEVMEETNQYKSDSDIYEQYILDNLLITKSNNDYINEKELFKHFNDWKLTEKKNMKTIIDKKTFIKDMSNKLGKTKNNNFIGIVIKDNYDLMTETENKSIASANTNDAIEYDKKMKMKSIIIKNSDMVI
jgi:P4 family phage/plasmid primase-like protien